MVREKCDGGGRLLVLNMKERAMRKQTCRWPFEAGKGKEANSSLEFAGGIQARQHFSFRSMRPMSYFCPPEL